MIESKDILQIGTLARTHGKSGELQCRMINTYWEDADAEFILLMLDNIPVPFRVMEWRFKGEDILFTLRNVTTEETALRLVGNDVYMLRTDIAKTYDLDILSWQDLVGYTINSCPIIEINDSTANILATMQDGQLIPMHEDLIIAIDHNAQTITMNLPEGL